MPAVASSKGVKDIVIETFEAFLKKTGRPLSEIDSSTNVARKFGLQSDEGVEFALDLGDAFGVEMPLAFNPFVDESGMRGRRFGDLVSAVQKFVGSE